MQRIEMHAKTKYSSDYDSLIDIEALLWNAKENKERGIVIVDKDSILAFPEVERVYKKLCMDDETFRNFKVCYGVQLTCEIGDKESEVVILVKEQDGLKNLYEIMSLYLNNDKKISYKDLVGFRNGLVIGIILNKDNAEIDLELFDYVEMNDDLDMTSIKYKKIVIYSNQPNSFLPGEKKVKEILYDSYGIFKVPECRLYLNTDEVLELCSDEDIVITNTNLLFDNLDRLVINEDAKYSLPVDDFEVFSEDVRNKFSSKYGKYKRFFDSYKIRLEKELQLIEEMNLLSYYKMLKKLTQYCKDNNEYYQLGGYINNSLVAFVLGLTDIEPCNLSYELFFSETPRIEFCISTAFYNKKMIDFLSGEIGEKLVTCKSIRKLSSENILEMISSYEKREHVELKSGLKDYIVTMLKDFSLEKQCKLNNSFYLIPEGKEITDFTPYILSKDSEIFKEIYFDYSDLENSLIPIHFKLSFDLDDINNLIRKTGKRIEQYIDMRVYNLFRNTEAFNLKFKFLKMKTGVLNVAFDYEPGIENRLTKMTHVGMEDLIQLVVRIKDQIIKDDLYSSLRDKGLDDLEIFTMLNYLEDGGKVKLVSRADLINEVGSSYQNMYYKLYYPEYYYDEMLNHSYSKDIFKKIKNYDKKKIIKRYEELVGTKDFSDFTELWAIEILVEMIERNINFKLEDDGVIVGQFYEEK